MFINEYDLKDAHCTPGIDSMVVCFIYLFLDTAVRIKKIN